MTKDQSQSERFKQAARELGCDEDDRRWDDRMRQVVAHKPAPEPAPKP